MCVPPKHFVWSCWRGKTKSFILVAVDTNSFQMSYSLQAETVPHKSVTENRQKIFIAANVSFLQSWQQTIHKTCNKCCLVCSTHKKTVKTLRIKNIPWTMKSFLYYFLPSFFFFSGLLSSSRMTSSAIRTLLVFDSSSAGPADRKKTRKLMFYTQKSGETYPSHNNII